MEAASQEQMKKNKMKEGFYQIQVLIQSTQGLVFTEGIDIDAMISISAFGQTKYSKPKKKVGHQMKIWGEQFSLSRNFSKGDMEELQKSLLKIKVWDHRKIRKNALVGEYEINLQWIYDRNKHILEHETVALSDINDNFGEISGLIKLSLILLNEEDKRIPLKMEPTSSSQKNSQIMLPPHIERKSYQLAVDIFEGRDIKPVDSGKTVDPYIGVEFGMIYSRTESIAKTTNPHWNQKVEVPVHTPSKISNIILRLIDANIFQAKEVLGSCYMDLNRLIYESENPSDPNNVRHSWTRYDRRRWVNFYGPQLNCKNNEAKHKYAKYPDHAPCFVGTILVKATMELKNNPIKIHTKHPSKGLGDGFVPPLAYYTVSAQFQMGMNLPSKCKEYALEIRIGGDMEKSSRPITHFKKNNYGFVEWNQQFIFSVAFYQNQQVPDIFIYLVNQDKQRICFKRHKVDFKEGVQSQWRMMKPDLSMINIHSEEAGYVKYTVNVQKSREQRKYEFKSVDLSERSVSRYSEHDCYIVIDLYCAQGLLAGDDDGSTDPYFKFSFKDRSKQSSFKRSTLNPIYLERIILQAQIGANNQILPMFVTVFNKNPIKDQTIGICYIDIQRRLKSGTITFNKQKNQKPEWFDLVIEDITLGRFLAGITIIQKRAFNPQKDLKFREDQLSTFNINLFILGLRNLTSSGLVAIRKPYIEFDFDSLYAYGDKVDKNRRRGVQFIQDTDKKVNQFSLNVKTDPVEYGTSINIKVPRKTEMKLPKNTLLWPTLSGHVKNCVIEKLVEPMVGFFSINLRDAERRTKQLKNRFMKKQRVIKYEELSENIEQTHGLSRISPQVTQNLRLFVVRQVNYNWVVMSEQIAGKLNKIRDDDPEDDRKRLDHKYVVILPKYRKEEDRDIFIQEHKDLINEEYLKIGYDSKEVLKKGKKYDRNRHYRYCLDQTYEDYYKRVHGVTMGVYDELPLRTGRVLLPEEQNQIFTRVFSDSDIEVGFYKGNCLITEKAERPSQSDALFQKTSQKMLASYMSNSKVKMFLYILNASSLPSKLFSANPSPFIVVKLGRRQIEFKDQVQKDTNSPQFNLLIKQELSFPEHSDIVIEVRDKDFTGLLDQLIGSTVIHAQNRVFSQFGKIEFNNPIETHGLKVQQSRVSQGNIKFWVDLVPTNQIDLYKQFNISSRAENQFELRVIIWSCSEVSSDKKDFTDMIDLYVTCEFNGEQKETDTHYRTENGEGSFNWRMIFPFKWPLKDDFLYLKVYDKEIIARNQGLAYGNIPLGKYIEQAYQNEIGVKLYEGDTDYRQQKSWPCHGKLDRVSGDKKYDIFVLELQENKAKGDEVDSQTGAKVHVSIEILTKSEAERHKAGDGQSDPNMHPSLPKPEGRMKWSWNPLTMISQLCGKKFKIKICLLIIAFFIISALVFLIPSYSGAILAKAGTTI